MKYVTRAIPYILWVVLAESGVASTQTEESFYYFAPIAVAVLAYLLDVRQARRYELEADAIKERMRAVELAHVSGFADDRLRDAIQDKSLTEHERRLDVLEGQEGGVPKEQGDKLTARLDDLSHTVGNIALAHNMLSNEVKTLKGEEDE